MPPVDKKEVITFVLLRDDITCIGSKRPTYNNYWGNIMKQRHQFKLNSLLSCMLLAGALPAVYAAEPQETAEVESTATTATTATTTETVADTDIEVIKVSGYRSSINAALLSKRAAVGSKETIIAEDIGKFPDLNVADSLSRIPGIAIEEDAGEGRQITVRGLGSRYVKTTINGMESASAGAATDAAGGQINLAHLISMSLPLNYLPKLTFIKPLLPS